MHFEFLTASICAAILILIWIIRCNIVRSDDESLILTHDAVRGMMSSARALPRAHAVRSRQLVLQMDAVMNNVSSKRNGGDSTAGIKRQPEGQDCPICLSGGEEEEEEEEDDDKADQSNTWVALNGCKHWFHSACIYAWLEKHETCPLCRVPYEMVVYM